MALINKIREKSGWAIGFIAIGLGIFVVGGDLLAPNSRIMGGNKNTVGEIAGEEIDYQQYDAVFQQIKANYENQSGRAATENELAMIREQAWNNLIFKIALQKEYDRLGIDVTEEELYDMVQGNNIHPSVRQSFTNPQTGEFDVNNVKQFLQNMDATGSRPMWTNFEQNLVEDRIQNKYINLFTKSVYITAAEAKNHYNAQNARANIKALFVPYYAIADSAVKPTDAQLKDYYERNKESYKVEAGRSIEFVTIPVTASGEDSTYQQTELSTYAEQFATTENDSAFVNANSDTPYSGDYLTVADLPEQLRSNLPLQEGKVYGPYNDNGTYGLYKVLDAKEGESNVARASHILIRPESDTPEAKAAAQTKANEVLGQIRQGADFAQMAAQHGTDGTASVGGDLGWFPEGRMVPAFEKAVFGTSSTGLLPAPVETDYGYHIIKITAPKTKQTYKIAALRRALAPSETSRDAAYSVADELSGTSGSLKEFRENAAKNPSLVKEESANIGKNQVLVNNLPSARELVRWTYEKGRSVGDVSPVYEINDQFVVASVTGMREKGYAKFEDIKEELTAAVRNELKAKQIIEKLKGTSGTLEEMAAKYGSEASVKTADAVTFASGTIQGVGFEPAAVGKAFGLKPGTKSAPVEGQSGVLVVELVELVQAPELNDLSEVRKQLVTERGSRNEANVFEAIKEKADVKDNRVRFF